MIRYAKPRTVHEALSLLGEERWKIFAGGTDIYPALANRPASENLLDINALDELRGIAEKDDHFSIGARTTWTDIIRAPLPPAFDALRQAAREVGSPQIQNVASLAGNLCNASPAADGVPALMVLDACVELRSQHGARVLPLAEFIHGNRRTALQPCEMMTAILIPRQSVEGTSAFYKLGARRYLVISVAMAAARVVTDNSGRITSAAVSVGSCSAVAQRLHALEPALCGLSSRDEISKAVHDAALPELSPIDDVRGSAGYRHSAAREIVLRALCRALGISDVGVAA